MSTVKERPILFSAPMILALLAGSKTQTRRVIKDIPSDCEAIEATDVPGVWYVDCRRSECGDIACPYGQPGDRLWVRETWRGHADEQSQLFQVNYRADDTVRDFDSWTTPFTEKQASWEWVPSIFMPRWASRITLEVTAVRVERLHDISDADAIAEGCQCAGVPASLTNRGAFAKLWEKINGKTYPWDSNPWVWFVEFRRVDQ
jgi:hypothetical protein